MDENYKNIKQVKPKDGDIVKVFTDKGRVLETTYYTLVGCDVWEVFNRTPLYSDENVLAWKYNN